LLGFFFDLHGKPVAGSVGSRVVGLTAADLRAIPRTIAITSEPDKTDAVLGALRTGIVDVLVTSVGIAQEVLTAAEREGEPASTVT
jgi:DNA-binding transcriptional regulator LsrR (DeoR family)